MMKVVIIIFSLATFGFASCFKNCSDTTYSFDVQAKMYPDKDSFHIGDTIWIEASCSTTNVDKITGKEVDYSNAENMAIAVSVLSLHPASGNFAGTVDATQEFAYIINHGVLISSDQYAVNFRYLESDSTYRLAIGCIPKDTGTYRLSVSDAVNVYRKNHKCDKATFAMSIVNTNQHFEFYGIVGPDAVPDDFARKHYYCFKVY